MSKSLKKKILRKQKRCQLLISEETKIPCTDQPTSILVICNAGLSTGLKEDELLQHIQQWAEITEIVMLPGKSYCFLKCLIEQEAIAVYQALHGKTNLAQNGGVLYLSYAAQMPKTENIYKELNEHPPGLILIKDFVNLEEEAMLLNSIDWDLNDGEAGSSLKHRQVKHYGYEFIYGANNIDINNPLDRKIPKACNFLWSRLKQQCPQLNITQPDQLTVNKYEPGQGIPPHVDTHSAFTGEILSLSLCSDVTMEFQNPITKRRVNIHLPKRSLLIMMDESRYAWTHGITSKMTDIIRTSSGSLTVVERSTRISFTFRRSNLYECACKYSFLCDTAKKSTENDDNKEKKILTENPARVEMDNVHKVYDKIAMHFSETRHSPWPEVETFVRSFGASEILIDIGCGNGKYLMINPEIVKIGCDRSKGLLKVCRDRNTHVFQCDCLNVPVRSRSVDGCISIAVIHHLATEMRRLQAINEMARILISGGRGLIYVWAKNQKFDNKKSSYLRQNKRNRCPNTSDGDNLTIDNVEYIDGLPVHRNRTEFVDQDVLVPWKRKDDVYRNCETFLRFYHVFDEGELDMLCRKISTIRLLRSYYDQGNWCVEFQKK